MFLASNLEKNLRKIYVFAFPEHLVTLGASILDLKSSGL